MGRAKVIGQLSLPPRTIDTWLCVSIHSPYLLPYLRVFASGYAVFEFIAGPNKTFLNFST